MNATPAQCIRHWVPTPAELAPIIDADTLPVQAADPIPLKTKAGQVGCYFIDLQACTPKERTALLHYYHGQRPELLEKTTQYLLNQSLPILIENPVNGGKGGQ